MLWLYDSKYVQSLESRVERLERRNESLYRGLLTAVGARPIADLIEGQATQPTQPRVPVKPILRPSFERLKRIKELARQKEARDRASARLTATVDRIPTAPVSHPVNPTEAA